MWRIHEIIESKDDTARWECNIYRKQWFCLRRIYHPYGVAIDSKDNLYVADTGNNRIQKIQAGWEYNILVPLI